MKHVYVMMLGESKNRLWKCYSQKNSRRQKFERQHLFQIGSNSDDLPTLVSYTSYLSSGIQCFKGGYGIVRQAVTTHMNHDTSTVSKGTRLSPFETVSWFLKSPRKRHGMVVDVRSSAITHFRHKPPFYLRGIVCGDSDFFDYSSY